MKKLTKQALLKMLQKNYFIGNVKNIFVDGKDIYVVYRFYMVRFTYSGNFGWSFGLYGEVLYSYAKYLARLLDNELEGKYYLGDISIND